MPDLPFELLRRSRAVFGLNGVLHARSEAALAAPEDTDAKVKKLIEHHGLELAALASLLAEGKLSKGQFIAEATALLTALAAQTGGMGAKQQGNVDAFSDADASTLMDSRADYLDGYAGDITSGKDSPAQIAQRAALWAGGVAWASYQSGRRSGAEANGAAQVTWVCEHDDASCEDCIMLAEQSPYDIGDLPTLPSQDVQCDGNCRCFLSFDKE